MYANGKGVLKNFELAYMWFSLASSQGQKIATYGMNAMEKKMSPQQIAEAQRLARTWKPKK